jgi:hypothetical protein
MAEKKFKGISVITAGPALGHEMVIDATTLEQVVEMGNEAGQLKVISDHSGSISCILGYLENFRLDGGRVRADLTLLESHSDFSYFSELLTTLPGQIGFSISFDGYPETADDGTRLARLKFLASCDLVLRPAANPTGVYSAKTVDRHSKQNMKEPIAAQEAKLEALAEAAPVAPAAPAPEAAPVMEPNHNDILKAIAELAGKMDAMLALQQADIAGEQGEEAPEAPEAPAMAAKVEETKLSEPEVKEEPKVEEAAPAVEATETNLSKNDEAGAKAELATLKIELEASRGIKPLETASNQPISRDEILKAFNAEKDPRRAAEIFKQLKFARK